MKLTNCQNDDDDDTDYDTNYIDIEEKINCTVYETSLSNCTCWQSGSINCASLGFYYLPLSLTAIDNQTTVNILFNNNSIRLFSQIKSNNGIVIKSINLSQNKLEDVVETNETSSDLEILILNDNLDFDLNKLSKLNLFQNLKILHINKIKSPLLIDDNNSFINSKRLSNLKEIKIQDTNLRFDTKTNGFVNLTNLEVLYLRNNNLKEIPCDRIKSFNKLKTLKYEFNNISSISTGCFAENKNLTKLYLREIFDLNDERMLINLFDENSKLEFLDISKNTIIKRLPYDLLSKLKYLKELFINVNEIIELTNNTKIDHQLSHLDLSNSIIESVPQNAFNIFSNLSELNLNNCSIKCLDKKSFNGLNNLKYVSVNI